MSAPMHWGDITPALQTLTAVETAPEWNRRELVDLLGPGDLRPAAVLVGLVEREQGLQVLLTVRAGDLRHHAGQVSFPGGAIERGDADAAAAALREADEEIGLQPAQAQPLGWLDPLATVSGFRVMPLVARISADFVPSLDPGEVEQAFEVPLGYLLSPANLRHSAVVYRGQPRQVVEYAPHAAQAPRIWGATAMVLQNFIRRLQTAGVLDHDKQADSRCVSAVGNRWRSA